MHFTQRGAATHRLPSIVKRPRFVSSRFNLSLLQEHVNLVGRDGENGPVLVSVKAETVAGQEHWRVLLRLRAGSTHELVPAVNLGPNPSPAKMVKVKFPLSFAGYAQQLFCLVAFTARGHLLRAVSRHRDQMYRAFHNEWSYLQVDDE